MTDMTVQIERIDEKLYLTSPYDRDFPPRAKEIGGRWDAGRHAWVFDERDGDRVRTLAAEFWGYSDDGSDGNTITVRIDPFMHLTDDGREVRFAGRRIAWRAERDSPVRLAGHVIIAEGRFPSRGGSKNNPRISYVDDVDVVLEIRDLPESALKTKDIGEYEVVHGDDERGRLIDERERLEGRIHAIDARIAELDDRKA